MKTTLNLPTSLIEEAMKAADTKTKTQAIILALNELIRRRKSRRLLKLKGSLKEDYDYKALRKKR